MSKYVIVKGGFGLGNRLLFLASAIIYAQHTGRTLVVDWNEGFYGPKGKDSFHTLFQLDDCASMENISKRITVVPEIWNSRLECSFYELACKANIPVKDRIEKLSASMSKNNYTEDAVVVCRSNFSVECLTPPERKSREKRNNAIQRVLNEILRPRDEVTEAVEKFADINYQDEVIGLHVRYTDNMHPRGVARNGAVDLEGIRVTINQLLDSKPAAKLFLATDSRVVLDDYRKTYPELLYLNKWFPGKARAPIHKNTIDRDDSYEIAKDALTELYLLARCDYFVYDPGSTFSEVACHLFKGDRSRLIPVDRLPPKTTA